LTLDLRDQLRLAERAAAIQELHSLAEQLRALYGADIRPGAAAQADVREVEGHCRAFWDKRDLILRRLFKQVSSDREQVFGDMLDLAILRAHLLVRLAGKNDTQARHDALKVLTQAQDLFGASSVLDCEIRAQTAALRLPSPAAKSEVTPRNAWEHFAVGRAHFHNGNLEEAAAQFDQALALQPPEQPQAFWPNFFKGKCAYQRGRHEDAVLAFTACLVLAPGKAWCHYNRGLAYEAMGQCERALNDYSRALQLDPALAMAAVNRGMLHYQAKRYSDAIEDLNLAVAAGADAAVVHYDRALIYLAQGNRAAALANLQVALRHEPSHEGARNLLESLR
jgi:tetratricopeptide (TPR) repeat protein